MFVKVINVDINLNNFFQFLAAIGGICWNLVPLRQKNTSKKPSFIDRCRFVFLLITIHAVKYGTLSGVNLFQSVITSHQFNELLKQWLRSSIMRIALRFSDSANFFYLIMLTFAIRQLKLTIVGLGPCPLDGRWWAMKISSIVTTINGLCIVDNGFHSTVRKLLSIQLLNSCDLYIVSSVIRL